MHNAVFEGRTLFSNGMSNTNRLANFGAIYVFNDDILFPKSHLGMHPHKNVEIVTVMLAGTESHRDTLGAHEEYQTGDVQLISSGKGLYHEGGNVSQTHNARHLQIWIAPRELDLSPSVQVLKAEQPSTLAGEKLLVSPDGATDSLKIQQDVWMYKVAIPSNHPYRYQLKNRQNGVLIYVLQGAITVNGLDMQSEDTAFISDVDSLTVGSETTGSEIFLIETIL